MRYTVDRPFICIRAMIGDRLMRAGRPIRFLVCGLVLFGSSLCGLPAETNNVSTSSAQAEVNFNRDIRPILANQCFKCHGPDLKKAGLDLQNAAAALRQLKSGNFAIVPGKSAESELIQRITSPDEDMRMPPKGKGEPLSAAQITKLRAWIDHGAKWEEHWAYVKPGRAPLPEVHHKGWVRNGIDYFVLARLEREGLAPAP